MVCRSITKVKCNLIVVIIHFVIIHVGISAVILRLILGILGHSDGLDGCRCSRSALIRYCGRLRGRLVIIITVLD